MALFNVLWFPLTLIFVSSADWPGLGELPHAATIGLMAGNSVLWGATLALLWRWWRLRRAKRERSVGDL